MVAWDCVRRVCPVCLKGFRAERRTAVYCSARCRQRAHRKPPPEAKMKAYYDAAHDGLMGLMTVDGRGVESFRAQKMLQSLVIEAIQALPDSTRRIIYSQIKEDLQRLT